MKLSPIGAADPFTVCTTLSMVLTHCVLPPGETVAAVCHITVPEELAPSKGPLSEISTLPANPIARSSVRRGSTMAPNSCHDPPRAHRSDLRATGLQRAEANVAEICSGTNQTNWRAGSFSDRGPQRRPIPMLYRGECSSQP
jgi:hypothetical protein